MQIVQACYLRVMEKMIILIVITEGYGVRATTIEGQNAFATTLRFAQVSRDRWLKHAWSVIEGPNARDQIVFYAFHSFLGGNPFQKKLTVNYIH